VKGEIKPMNKNAWAEKFKKYAVLAGVNEPKKSCRGVVKRASRWLLTPTAPRAR
jgi:hypothetical protein